MSCGLRCQINNFPLDYNQQFFSVASSRDFQSWDSSWLIGVVKQTPHNTTPHLITLQFLFVICFQLLDMRRCCHELFSSDGDEVLCWSKMTSRKRDGNYSLMFFSCCVVRLAKHVGDLNLKSSTNLEIAAIQWLEIVFRLNTLTLIFHA